MKKYIILSVSLIFSLGVYAQKSEIRSMKKILEKEKATDDDYKKLQSLIDATTPYIGNAKPEEQAEFFYHKGNYEMQVALRANSLDAFTKAVESFNRMKNAELNEKRKTFSDKFEQELFPVLRPQAFKKAIDLNKNNRFRESSTIFKGIYDLDKNFPIYLYYAASMSINAQDYNMALEYYQELLDMNFTGEGVYYTAVDKKTGEIENFGENKNLMLESVKFGSHVNPKQEKEPSKRPEILKNMVFIYTSVNQKTKAEQFLEEARKENPDDFDLLMVHASFLMQSKEIEKFEALMQEAIKKNPTNPELYFNLGVVSAESKNIEKAREYYQKTIQLDPKFVNAYINLGTIILNDEAEIVEQMNSIKGFSAAENQKYDKLKTQREDLLKFAISYFQKALSIEADNQIAIANLVEIYGALDMLDKQAEYKAMLTK